MHMPIRFLPWDQKPSPMAAENGIRRVFPVGLPVVSNLFHHTLGIMTGKIPAGRKREPPFAPGIVRQLFAVIAHAGERGSPGQAGGRSLLIALDRKSVV